LHFDNRYATLNPSQAICFRRFAKFSK